MLHVHQAPNINHEMKNPVTHPVFGNYETAYNHLIKSASFQSKCVADILLLDDMPIA